APRPSRHRGRRRPRRVVPRLGRGRVRVRPGDRRGRRGRALDHRRAPPPPGGRPCGALVVRRTTRPGRTRAVVLTGGPHPFAQTTPRVVDLLAETGVASTVVSDPDTAAGLVAAAGPRTLLVLNTLRWRMRADRYAPQRDAHAYATSPALRRRFAAH